MKINKKRNLQRKKNRYIILVYFISGLIWLNNLPDSLYSHAIGVALMIAAVYGVVCINKDQKFLF